MILPIAPIKTVKTVHDVLAPMFSRGDLPEVVRLQRAWARWSTGDCFTWSDLARGYLSPDRRFVVRADTIRGAPHIFEAQAAAVGVAV